MKDVPFAQPGGQGVVEPAGMTRGVISTVAEEDSDRLMAAQELIVALRPAHRVAVVGFGELLVRGFAELAARKHT